jgi:hypothetical protein
MTTAQLPAIQCSLLYYQELTNEHLAKCKAEPSMQNRSSGRQNV